MRFGTDAKDYTLVEPPLCKQNLKKQSAVEEACIHCPPTLNWLKVSKCLHGSWNDFQNRT